MINRFKASTSNSLYCMKKQSGKHVISASEIGQYHYCSISWFLRRSGCIPHSSRLTEGKEKHVQLGETIATIQNNTKKISFFTKVTYVLLFLGLILLVLGWML